MILSNKFPWVGFLLVILTTFFVHSNCSILPDQKDISHNETESVHIQEYSWFIHFLRILLDYLIIIAPISLLVFLVKRNIFPPYIKQIKFIKLLVFGVPNNESDDFLPLTQSDLEEKITKPSQEKNNTFCHLLYCFFGLQISFLTWGILQEKIMTQNYILEKSYIESHLNQVSDNLISIVATDSQNPEIVFIKFRNAQFLVLVNRILAFIIAVIVLIYNNRKPPVFHQSSQSFFETRQPPFYMYMYCSLSNIMSSWCQYEALKYLSFPAQVLSKGCKMIPTMLMNQIIMGQKQKKQEWLFAIAISFGMTIFMLNEQRQSHVHATTSSSNVGFISGLIILALYLIFDSFTSNWQQSLFDQYRTLTSVHMMAAVNFYSIIFTMVSLLQESDFFPAVSLLFANPILLRDCIVLSICSASGQLFIFHTISTFGAIVFSLIMTLRQAFAILLSCLIYSHSISFMGLVGILIIFASLFIKSYLKFIIKTNKKTNVKSSKSSQI